MKSRALKVLLIDDDEDDYLITEDLLSEVTRTRYDTIWLSRREEALSALLTGGYDICLLDYRLEGCTGLDILNDANDHRCVTPIIMLTGVGDENIDMEAMAAGAADYLVKGRFDAQLLERTIRYAIGHKKSQIELEQHAESLEQSNKELVQLHAELLRLNEEKNRFVGMAAHDLRNPLGVIMGYSDLMLMNHRRSTGGGPRTGAALGENEMNFVEKIKSSSKFMLSLIDDLLDISTIESGKLNLDLTSTDVVRLVEANVGLNMVLAGQKHMTLVLESGGGIPHVDLDARKVEQVLNNLITNAIHYSPPGTTIAVEVQSSHVRAGVAAASARAEVMISVADQGPGIPPEDIGNLFRPFGRARSVSTGGERATGLGLAIARRIVEGHGGRIWVESEFGHGSTFFVAFPIADAEGVAPAVARAPA